MVFVLLCFGRLMHKLHWLQLHDSAPSPAACILGVQACTPYPALGFDFDDLFLMSLQNYRWQQLWDFYSAVYTIQFSLPYLFKEAILSLECSLEGLAVSQLAHMYGFITGLFSVPFIWMFGFMSELYFKLLCNPVTMLSAVTVHIGMQPFTEAAYQWLQSQGRIMFPPSTLGTLSRVSFSLLSASTLCSCAVGCSSLGT